MSFMTTRIPELSDTIPGCQLIFEEWQLRFLAMLISVKNLSLTFEPVQRESVIILEKRNIGQKSGLEKKLENQHIYDKIGVEKMT